MFRIYTLLQCKVTAQNYKLKYSKISKLIAYFSEFAADLQSKQYNILY